MTPVKVIASRTDQELKPMRPCPICSSTNARLLYTKRVYVEQLGRDFELELRACGCGMVFASNPPDLDLYDYYASRIGKSKNDLFNIETSRRIRQLLQSMDRKPGRLLDVGCGMGQIVSVAIEEGWDAFGIETSVSAVRLCQSLDLPVAELDFFSKELKREWDVIVMSEVLEHTSDPVSFIGRAADLLQPDGRLYLSVPNFDALERRLLGKDWDPIHPEHLNYFNPATLERVLARAGFRPLTITTENVMIGGLLGGIRRKLGFNRTKRVSRRMDIAVRKAIGDTRLKTTVNATLNRMRLGCKLKALCALDL